MLFNRSDLSPCLDVCSVENGSQPTSAKDLNTRVCTWFSSVWVENSQFGVKVILNRFSWDGLTQIFVRVLLRCG